MIVYSKELKEGMKLKQAIYYGNFMLIDKDNILTGQIIGKIIDYGINYVDVHEENEKRAEDFKKIIEQENVLKDIFKSNYSYAVENTKVIVENIIKGEIDKSKIDTMVSETINNLEIDKNILVGLIEGETEENYLAVHTVNTLTFALIIGMAIGYDQNKMKLLGKAAFLHDIGMSKISKDILNKEGELSEDDMREIKKHPIIGANLATNMEKDVIDAMKYHHERIDGSGYPEGLVGKNIPEMARIISIADVYSALTENRIYRSKYSYFDAMKIMMQESSNALDSDILKRFLKYMPIYPINSIVYLNDGKFGKVVKANPNPFRPVVDIKEGENIIRIDLTETENLTKYIVSVKNT